MALSIASVLWFLVASALGLWRGPDWLVILGEMGVGLSFLSILVGLPKRSPFGHPGIAAVGLFLNLLLILTGKGLDLLFIHPPTPPHIPALVQPYEDPSRAFRIKVPSGWVTEPESRGELGTSIHLKPTLRNRTSGINQIDILVRPLAQSVQDVSGTLNQLVKWIKTIDIEKKGGKSLGLSIIPEHITFANGNPGLYLRLETQRWWIPVREDVLYAAQPGRFLCMITASGLAAYVPHYRPLLVKLYESIETPAPQ